MAGNGYGTHKTTRERLMSEHDALPAALRQISCFAVAKWHAGSIHMAYDRARDAGYDHRRSVDFTARWVSDQEVEDTLADYGPDHPEARR